MHPQAIASLCFAVFAFVALKGYDCQELTCPDESVERIFSMIVEADSPRGSVNLMFIQHDAERLQPLTSTALYDQMNHEQNAVRVDNFRRHSCPSIYDNQTLCHITFKTTPEQQNISGGRTAFDRGHLTPVNPMRFSAEAVNHTFFCINIAPQDPYTNQNPWFTVEDRTHKYFNDSAAYVMTGICDLDDVYSPTAEGYRIPACFWKMNCYVDKNGDTQVVGFIGNNTLLRTGDDDAHAERTASTTTARSQQEVLNLMNRQSFVLDAWDAAERYLTVNRNPSNAHPSGASCKAKLQLPDSVRNEWSGFMRDGVMQHEFTEATDLHLVKKYWNTV